MATGWFVSAERCSASSARPWPSASSRPSSSSPSPRIASLRFSSSSLYESTGSGSIRSTPSSRRTSITGVRQCHGSSRKSEPSLPIASSSSRSGIAVPQSKIASTSPGNRSWPVNTQSVPVSPKNACPKTLSGSPPRQPRAADAVAADVHQRAALDVRAQPDVVRVVERVAERRADEPELADRALVDQLLQPLRLRIVAVHEGLGQEAAGAVGRVERRLDLLRMARERLLAQHVLAGLDRADRPFAVHRVRQGDVDGLDLRILEQLPRTSRTRARSPTPAHTPRRARSSRLATPTRSTFGDSCAPGMTSRLMCAVEMIPHLTASLTRHLFLVVVAT